jgi:ribonuclease III
MTEEFTLEALEVVIGYPFKNRDFLELALTHTSFANEKNAPSQQNERLEFLGDAILSAILADALYQSYPAERENFLARARSVLGQGTFLIEIAERLQLKNWIRLGGEVILRPSMLEDALEALVGAVFLDSGFECCRETILRWFGDLDEHLKHLLNFENLKGRLQERFPPPIVIEYRSTFEGPSHKRFFQAEVWISGEKMGCGSGDSKKKAENAAALEALQSLNEKSVAFSPEASLE